MQEHMLIWIGSTPTWVAHVMVPAVPEKGAGKMIGRQETRCALWWGPMVVDLAERNGMEDFIVAIISKSAELHWIRLFEFLSYVPIYYLSKKL